MTSKVKKIIALTVALLILIASFASCGAKEAVITCGKHSVSADEFKYYLATYKGKFATVYSDFSDTEDFYNSKFSDGRTIEEYLFDTVVESVKMTLVANAMFDEYDLRLSESTEEMIDDYIDSMIEDMAGGDKNALNKKLSEYGINLTMLREIYLRDERTASLLDFLYGDDGEIGVTDADRTDYLNENYVRIRHIYVNNKFKYSADENGYLIYTDEGYAKTESLTEDEEEAKNALIAAIEEAIADGGDFNEIYEGLSEDKHYENGYYLTRNTDFVDDVVKTAFELEIGEYAKIDSAYGVHYIMRLEMDDAPWADTKNEDFFDNFETTVATELFTEIIKSRLGDVQCSEDVLAGFSISESPTNYKY